MLRKENYSSNGRRELLNNIYRVYKISNIRLNWGDQLRHYLLMTINNQKKMEPQATVFDEFVQSPLKCTNYPITTLYILR